MTKKKRGQSSVEYVLTYMWVILVIILGLIVVWKMNILKPPTGNRIVTGFSQITVLDFKASRGSDEITLFLKSVSGSSVSIPIGGATTVLRGVSCAAAPSGVLLIKPSEEKLITFDCSVPPTIADSYNLGDRFKANVTISYVNGISGQPHQSIGFITGSVES